MKRKIPCKKCLVLYILYTYLFKKYVSYCPSNLNLRSWDDDITPWLHYSKRANMPRNYFTVGICSFFLCLDIVIRDFHIRLYFNHHNLVIKFNNKIRLIPMVCIPYCVSPEESFELIWSWSEPILHTTVSIKKICKSSLIRRIKFVSFMTGFRKARIYLRS
jgi:hypothetical protein